MAVRLRAGPCDARQPQHEQHHKHEGHHRNCHKGAGQGEYRDSFLSRKHSWVDYLSGHTVKVARQTPSGDPRHLFDAVNASLRRGVPAARQR